MDKYLDYTRGGCAALALALHDITGFPIGVVYGRGYNERRAWPQHVVVVNIPDQYAIDISGKHTVDDLLMDWAENGYEDVDLDDDVDRAQLLRMMRPKRGRFESCDEACYRQAVTDARAVLADLEDG